MEDDNNTEYKEYVNFADEVLRECGKIILEWRGKPSPIEGLYLNEAVSKYVSDHIFERLKEVYPNHNLYTKGSHDIGKIEYEWICDPLDGAFVYYKGLTSCVISMTLVHNGTPIIAAIYQPFMNDMYLAVENCGVTKNGVRLETNHQKLEKFMCIDEEWWPDAAYDIGKIVHGLSHEYSMYPIHLGSVVYSACLVVEGILTATLFGGRLTGKNHEAAAVMLLMQEAGGRYTDLNGTKIGFKGTMYGFIISTENSFDQIRDGVNRYLGKAE